ncbi:type IV fimbrial biogenesis protein FimT [Collimonas sp. PA-H2]|uniref:GspH/FimT family pseudopilin n=1 Tax=Collimonas sp. PA-H2 TaxID=1881062 RepID=UPI000C0072F1|nr:type IV fimbrial biogenesis protein FimT [Collimonas sp. PA-H2]
MQRNTGIVLSIEKNNKHIVSIVSRGFTLIELMVTIVVVAILAAVGLPSMGNFIAQNRLSGNVNEFIGATMLTRSEAIQRSGAVTICRSANAETATTPACDTTATDWNSGWLVYVGTAATTPAASNILARQGPFTSGTNIAATSAATTPTLTSITYNASGTPMPAPPDYFTFSFNSKFSRLVCFSPSGRTSALPAGSTSCPT